jgi:hypothetical protein
MNDLQKRFALFLIGCIGLRSLLVYIAKTTDVKYLQILGYLAIIPAIGFSYIFITGSRKTGTEVFGGKIWWNKLRPIHAILYGLFAYNAINKNKEAWVYLLIDVIIGFISFIVYHYMEGNFTNVFN